MEILEKLAIKIPYAVLVDGATQHNSSEVLDFLEQYGDINRNEIIDCSESELHQMLVVEFASGSSVDKLSPLLPYTFTSDEGNKFHIQDLAQIYLAKLGSSKTDNYLSDLKQIAKMSGKDYTVVLGEMMSQIQQSILQLHPAASTAPKVEPKLEQPTPPLPHTEPPVPPLQPGFTTSFPSAERRSLTPGDLDPPEVQRYVVEHVVRSSDTSLHASHRLRPFSGKVPRSNHEMDYDTWRSGVELVLRDPSISDLQRSRLIRDSLLPPACDLVKHLSPDTLPNVYLQQLESAYGTVQDGEELYAKFMDTYQNHGEKPSEYLQRLQVALQHAVRRGGVSERDTNHRLLAQFCRGCWENGLISELQLKQRKINPPSFAEFLLLLRTEEDREAAKNLRMKQHLGARQKVSTQAQLVTKEDETSLCTALANLTQQLSQQMTAIQRQLAALTASQIRHSSMDSAPRAEKRKSVKSSRPAPPNPKPGFCFRCGEDGHIRPQCDADPNPALVNAKRKQFQDKQQKWQTRNPTSYGHLN